MVKVVKEELFEGFELIGLLCYWLVKRTVCDVSRLVLLVIFKRSLEKNTRLGEKRGEIGRLEARRGKIEWRLSEGVR